MAHGASLNTKSFLEETPLGKTRKPFWLLKPQTPNNLNNYTFNNIILTPCLKNYNEHVYSILSSI